ncbi:MAG: hypothetical protein PF439_03575 [Helicobacteraceae bacterium]|jgi:hypothetical protein|nr:hypothetical protein [Helicobacteraceae bacterium]
MSFASEMTREKVKLSALEKIVMKKLKASKKSSWMVTTDKFFADITR